MKKLNEYISDAINILEDDIRKNKPLESQYIEVISDAFNKSLKETEYTAAVIDNKISSYIWDIPEFETKINISKKSDDVLSEGINIELHCLYGVEPIYKEVIDYRIIGKIFKIKNVRKIKKGSYIKEIDVFDIDYVGKGYVEEEIRASILLRRLEAMKKECEVIYTENSSILKNKHKVSDFKKLDINKLVNIAKEYNEIVDKLSEK